MECSVQFDEELDFEQKILDMAPARKLRNVVIGIMVIFCVSQLTLWLLKTKTENNQPVPYTVLKPKPPNVAKSISAKHVKETKQRLKESKKLQKDAEMKARVVLLRNTCKSLGYVDDEKAAFDTSYLDHIIVDQKNKVLFCYIPKVANTNFRRVFLATTGVVSKENAWRLTGHEVYHKYIDKIDLLQSFSEVEREKMLSSYKKFMFVREPLERLLSAYRNKFFHPNSLESVQYYKEITRFYKKFSILGKKRKLAIDAKNRSIAFTDFLTYWTDVYEVGRNVDEHFALASDLCWPCHVSYDFIGKFYSLNEDAEYIFDKLGLGMRFPGRNDNYSETETTKMLQEHYKRVPKPLLRKVRKFLSVDFDLFGYPVTLWMT